MEDLRTRIAALANGVPAGREAEGRELFAELRVALDQGTVRAAERNSDGTWRVNLWVKQGILLGFRLGVLTEHEHAGPLRFFDKDDLPLKTLDVGSGVRVVPGGSAVRAGAYLAPGVICMPPMYVNIGAHVGEGTLIDSHALVGSCAQIGRRVHLSAAAQVGGVLEPPGALPVIIEDDVFIGGNCGIYEGTVVRERAVLAPGTIVSGATPVYDLVRDAVYHRGPDGPLEIPPAAVVVPGSRPATTAGRATGIGLYTPVIVKYRDAKTDAATRIEDLLRPPSA